jgi:ABC-type sugar transport system ATPase subunit
MDIVQLRNIKKQYGEKVIFQGINLNIPAGFLRYCVVKAERENLPC